MNANNLFIQYMQFIVNNCVKKHELRDLKPDKFNLLLVGYIGRNNTGSEMRIFEIYRQMQALLETNNLHINLLTLDTEQSQRYYQINELTHLPTIYPLFLSREIPQYDAVVICEGSTFKNRFSIILSLLFAGSMAIAKKLNAFTIAYGAEADAMTPKFTDFLQKNCQETLALCRNDESRHILEKFGLKTDTGTDTAWTFQPAEPSIGRSHLIEHGWDGQAKILAICPLNPYWFPINLSLVEEALYWIGCNRQQRFREFVFHDYNKDDVAKYKHYLQCLSQGVNQYLTKHPEYHPIIVGMEDLDKQACFNLKEMLNKPASVFLSRDYDAFQLVSILRHASLLISSRYHAIVSTLPAMVPSVALSIDNRIPNLFQMYYDDNYTIQVDELKTGEQVYQLLSKKDLEDNSHQEKTKLLLKDELYKMSQMGKTFLQELALHYPGLSIQVERKHWVDYLPPLPKSYQWMRK